MSCSEFYKSHLFVMKFYVSLYLKSIFARILKNAVWVMTFVYLKIEELQFTQTNFSNYSWSLLVHFWFGVRFASEMK